MPCDTNRRRVRRDALGRRIVVEIDGKTRLLDVNRAIDRLEQAIGSGAVKVVVGRQSGAVAFQGWKDDERDGVTDVCAYRRLTQRGSSALRMAMARAEALAGRKVNEQAVAAGVHSHDGGATWGRD